MSLETWKTAKGYDVGEVTSALQKSIRRGLEKEALYWACEMDLSGMGAHLWKRLLVITSEDVGIATPALPAQIRALYENWREIVEKKKPGAKLNPDRMFTTHAVMLLCRSRKCRIVDHAQIATYRGHGEEQLEIPEWALDKHTLRGKKMGRGFDHFWAEGTKLENEDEVVKLNDPYKAIAMKVARNTVMTQRAVGEDPDDSQDEGPTQGELIPVAPQKRGKTFADH